MSIPSPVRLTPKDIAWLTEASWHVGEYPGQYWDLAPKRYGRLYSMGLVTSWDPPNMSHKTRAVITPAGIAALTNKDAEK